MQHFLQSVLWPKDHQGQGGRERGAGQGLNFCSDRGWLPGTKFLFCAAPCCPVVLRRSPWVWFAKQNRVTRDSSNGIASQSHRAPRRRHPCSCRSDAGAHHRHRRRGVWARSLGPAPASTPALAPRAHRLTRPPPHAPTAARAHRRTRPTRRPRPPPPSSAAPMRSWRLPRRSAMTRQVARQCGIGLCLPLFRECRRSSGHRV